MPQTSSLTFFQFCQCLLMDEPNWKPKENGSLDGQSMGTRENWKTDLEGQIRNSKRSRWNILNCPLCSAGCPGIPRFLWTE